MSELSNHYKTQLERYIGIPEVWKSLSVQRRTWAPYSSIELDVNTSVANARIDYSLQAPMPLLTRRSEEYLYMPQRGLATWRRVFEENRINSVWSGDIEVDYSQSRQPGFATSLLLATDMLLEGCDIRLLENSSGGKVTWNTYLSNYDVIHTDGVLTLFRM